MKSLKEQIEVMTHLMNGGEVEYCYNNNWLLKDSNVFNWHDFDYRIKEEKKTITIEKWLCLDTIHNDYFEFSSSNIEAGIKNLNTEKIKILESYEVEL